MSLDLPPTQDSSAKSRLSFGFPNLNIWFNPGGDLILVVTKFSFPGLGVRSKPCLCFANKISSHMSRLIMIIPKPFFPYEGLAHPKKPCHPDLNSTLRAVAACIHPSETWQVKWFPLKLPSAGYVAVAKKKNISSWWLNQPLWKILVSQNAAFGEVRSEHAGAARSCEKLRAGKGGWRYWRCWRCEKLLALRSCEPTRHLRSPEHRILITINICSQKNNWFWLIFPKLIFLKSLSLIALILQLDI